MRIFIFIIALGCLIVCCEKGTMSPTALSTGVGGSLAKFTIIGNYLYAVSSHNLYTIDISDPAHPTKVNQSSLSFDMETIYPYKNRLFIGSRQGLYIYSIDTPNSPTKIGEAKHGRSCDPIIANDSVSYTTLKGNSVCGPATSGLYVHDVKNLSQPVLKKTIAISDPAGLGMSDSALYVCCSSEGLKVFSIQNAYDPVEVRTISGESFTDVIVYNDILICWVGDGISLYDISNKLQPSFITKVLN